MKRALVSLSDKAGIEAFAAGLSSFGFQIISTGNTFKALQTAGIAATEVADVTGFAECLDGRVKTLHPAIHAGLLARRDVPAHMGTLERLGFEPFDIVCVNLYPFKQTVLGGATHEQIIENIDIGGPAMIRSAAKNHESVCVIIDPKDYDDILKELAEHGEVTAKTRLALAAKAFAHTAAYDALVAQYLAKHADLPAFPDSLTLTYEKVQDLRYGENPHQKAAFYREAAPVKDAFINFEQIGGKELSFNNINDAWGAVAALREFSRPAAVAVKHATPCGVGEGDSLHEAFIKAKEADPVSIFGGIAAFNRPVDAACANEISKIFVELVIAPDFDADALEILRAKRNLRLLKLPSSQVLPNFDHKKVCGGLLVQETDSILFNDTLEYVTERKPSENEMADLHFAWKLVKHVKSNGIAIGKNGQSLGLAGGQVSRIWACKQAIEHAHEFLGQNATIGAALASDAFFPFPDCVKEAAKAGITAIIQPGGSQNDALSIAECNKNGIAMVFTGVRHFRH